MQVKNDDVLDDPVGKPFTLRDEIAELRAERKALVARVGELIDRWRRKADVNAPASIERSAVWDSAANQLEALLREE